jgi:SAM-dependent methyltransferase
LRYAFGDTDIAARRLEYLAEVFAEPSRAFLLDAARQQPQLAVDLGCGPGYSTHFLAETVQCRHAVGLDNSERFIALARKTETDRVSFDLHDVISVPFPVDRADLLYCRYLLTHLREPERVIASWAAQLNSGGLLLMEEVEWIDTKCEAFSAYITIVEALLAAQSHNLYVGPVVDALELPGDLRKRSSDVRRFRVRAERAAPMFLMNLETWRHTPFVKENYPPDMIDRLEEDLRVLAERPSAGAEIEWGLRQTALERV